MDRSSSIRQRHAVGVARSGTRRLRQSIDLRAHGPALEAMAKSRRISLAALVRTALAEWLASRAVAAEDPAADDSPEATAAFLRDEGCVKVTLRMPAGLAFRLAREARAAEVSQGLYVAQLVERLPPRRVSTDQRENRCALLASTATLAALCGDLQALERALGRAGSVDLAACKAVTDLLPDLLDRHLALSSALLADLAGPRRSVSGGPGALLEEPES